MATEFESRAYPEVHKLLSEIGGEMTYKPGGGPGGVWVLALRGRTREIEVRNRSVNTLDRLYESRVENPRTWDDYEPHARLLPDAFWRLVQLF